MCNVLYISLHLITCIDGVYILSNAMSVSCLCWPVIRDPPEHSSKLNFSHKHRNKMLEGNLNRIITRQLKLSYHVVQRYSRSARLPKREKILNCAIREIWMYRILFWMMYKRKNQKLDKVWTHIADTWVNTIRKEECGEKWELESVR